MRRQRVVDPAATTGRVAQRALRVSTQAAQDAATADLERYRDTDEPRLEAPLVTGSTADGTALKNLLGALSEAGVVVPSVDVVDDEVVTGSVVTDRLSAADVSLQESLYLDGIAMLSVSRIVTTLSAGINSSTTSVSVTDGTKVPEANWIRVDDEIMYVSSISGNTLTVIRAEKSTTAASHSINADVWYDQKFEVNRGYEPGPTTPMFEVDQRSATFDVPVTMNSTLNVSGTATLGNAQADKHVIWGNEIKTKGTQATATALANAGTGRSIAVETGSNDLAGVITLTTGTGTSAGDQCRLLFTRSRSVAADYVVILQQLGGSWAGEVIWARRNNSAYFTVTTQVALAASTTYSIGYLCIEFN